MKKRTLLASTVALIGAGIMGAISPNVTQTNADAQARQVAEQNQKANGPTRDQSAATGKRRMTAEDMKALSHADYLPTVGVNRNRSYSKWCSIPRSGGFNKITHSRRTKRKHRRA